MGIRGLTTFVALCNLCEHKLKKFLPSSAQTTKMKIVIDGGALIHHIYFSKKIDFISGGQLDQLEHECTVFFNALLHAGFSPYVIFDGLTPDIKVAECVVRQTTSVLTVTNHMQFVDSAPNRQVVNSPVLPIFAQLVMVNVLNQLKVPYSVSDYEADAVAGTHANNNGCAVLSKDSDFYVFPVVQGYIALDSLNVFPDKLTFDFFKTDSLVELLKVKTELLPAFASLCGNDFVSRESLWGFHMYLRNEIHSTALSVPDSRCYDIARVGKFVSSHSSIQEAFEAAADCANKFIEHFKTEKGADVKLIELMKQEATPPKTSEKKEEEKKEEKKDEKKAEEGENKAEEKVGEKEEEGKEEKELQEQVSSLDISGEITINDKEKEKEEEKEKNEKEKILAMDPAARKAHLMSLLSHSAEQYISQNITVGKDTSLTLHSLLVPRYNNSPNIPLSLLHQYRQYLFNDELMGVLCKLTVWCVNMVENTARPKSSWTIALPIRKVIYGILCGGGAFALDPSSPSSSPPSEEIVITEYVREGDKCTPTKVIPSYLLMGRKLPSLPTVMGLPPKTRLTLFLDILSSNLPSIAAFEQWTFAIASLRAWVVVRSEEKEKERRIQEWELMAIILNFVSRPHYTQSINLRQQQNIPRTRDMLHFLAEWRAMIYSCILACNCLFNPIPVPSPAALYDGEMILHYLIKCQNKNLDYRKILLKKSQDIDVFDKIYACVTEGLEDKISKKDNIKVTEAEEKKKEIMEKLDTKKNAAKHKEKAAVKQNMFDMLADDEEPASKNTGKKTPAKKK